MTDQQPRERRRKRLTQNDSLVLRAPTALLDKLKAAAAEDGVTVSTLVRSALTAYAESRSQ